MRRADTLLQTPAIFVIAGFDFQIIVMQMSRSEYLFCRRKGK